MLDAYSHAGRPGAGGRLFCQQSGTSPSILNELFARVSSRQPWMPVTDATKSEDARVAAVKLESVPFRCYRWQNRSLAE